MKTRSLLSLLFAACLLVGALAPAGLADQGKGKKKGKKKSGPQVVGKDADDDWGANVDPTLNPLGDLLGQELVEAQMQMGEKGDTVNFIIKLKSLPGPGGVPELTRYGWDFSVDGNAMLISGAFTEYLRGVCYPFHANSCPPPQDPGPTPFFVRSGPCAVGTGGVGECNIHAVVSATFDAATGTITVPVPLEALDAKPGSKIEPLPNASFGETIYATTATVLASPNAPHDTMSVTETFVVMSGKKKK